LLNPMMFPFSHVTACLVVGVFFRACIFAVRLKIPHVLRHPPCVSISRSHCCSTKPLGNELDKEKIKCGLATYTQCYGQFR
ncbi:hypothetical protein AVEN_178541-1, partial [Araneus ventricosus]